MRLFNKHYKPRRQNPAARIVRSAGKKFEQLYRKNPEKYDKTFEAVFGKKPMHKRESSPHYDWQAELYEELSKMSPEQIEERLSAGLAGTASRGQTRSYQGDALDHALGVPYSIAGTAFRALVEAPDEDDAVKVFQWKIYAPDDSLLLSGHSKSKSKIGHTITRGVKIISQAAAGEKLTRDDRFWLGTDKVTAHPAFERLGDSVPAQVQRGGVQAYESKSRGAAQTFRRPPPSISLGDTEEIKGRDYTVMAKRDREGYWVRVATKPDPETGKVFETGWAGPYKGVGALEKAYAKASLIGGQLTGAREFIENPGRRKTLYSGARRTLAKSNPKEKRAPLTGVENIDDLVQSMGIPSDAEEAYRVGYAWGVIRGLDTCGIQNYFKRVKIRKQYDQEILKAYKQIADRTVGPVAAGTRPRAQKVYG